MNTKTLSVIRHLTEVDDLRDNRDGKLIPGQEQEAKKIAIDLHENIQKHKNTNLLFICSPKTRSIDTAKMTQKYLLELNPELKIEYAYEEKLTDIHHGNYNLPEDYKPGDNFPGFTLADKIFYDEIFGEVERNFENFLYRYGDPIKNEEGTFTYPQLLNYFHGYGENFREALVRIYGEALKIGSEYFVKKPGFEPIVFTHGLPLEIFKDLTDIAKDIVDNGYVLETGKMARVCFQKHTKRNSEKGSHGKVHVINLDSLTNDKFTNYLIKEIAWLESL